MARHHGIAILLSALVPAVPAVPAGLFGAPVVLAQETDPARPTAPPLAGRKAELNLEVLFGPDSAVAFGSRLSPSRRWLDDERYLERADGGWLVVTAASGEAAPLYAAGEVAAALAKAAGITPATALDAVGSSALELDPEAKAGLLTLEGDLWHVPLSGAGTPRRLTRGSAGGEVATFSPDGRRVSFVRAGDLYAVAVDAGEALRLTADGGDRILNGKLDWVYQEEIYGRGSYRGHWWSPDSKRIAFLRLDDTQVPEATLADPLGERPPETLGYPRPGDPNPVASLGVVAATGGAVTWVDLEGYREHEPLVVRVGWTPDSRRVVVQVQDRAQKGLHLLVADPATGAVRVLVEETSPAWVDVLDEPRWLADGSFLWLSEASGHRHLYRHDAEGKRIAALTAGAWQVASLLAVDEAKATVYFTASRDDGPLATQLWAVGLDGSGLRRISRRAGSHRPEMSPGAVFYLDRWSDLETPPQVRLHAADGTEIRVLDANPAPELETFERAPVEVVRLPTAEGAIRPALLYRPPGWAAAPSRRYPVLLSTYGGPGGTMVRDAWRGRSGLWHELLARQGIAVLVVDTRSSAGRSAAEAWPSHRRLGERELADLEAAVGWLEEQPWADAVRVGIRGWSYGGYLAAYALTHSRRFRAGIAGAPVTDWRFYDSIYTERYMDRPADNPEGYAASSAIEAAARLSGRLLLIHGGRDENVHPVNTLALADAFQRAGRPFDLMLYPASRHGVVDPERRYHLYRLMTDFLRRYL